MPSSHLIHCYPLLLLPPIPPSITVFSNESTLHMRWPKYWSFSFSIIPSKEHPGLISFRMDWLDLLAVQRTLKSLLQHHRSKASILRRRYFIGSCLQLKFPNHQSLLHFLTSFVDICKSSKMLSLGYYDVIWNKSLLIYFPKISWVFAGRNYMGRSEYYLALGW